MHGACWISDRSVIDSDNEQCSDARTDTCCTCVLSLRKWHNPIMLGTTMCCCMWRRNTRFRALLPNGKREVTIIAQDTIPPRFRHNVFPNPYLATPDRDSDPDCMENWCSNQMFLRRETCYICARSNTIYKTKERISAICLFPFSRLIWFAKPT